MPSCINSLHVVKTFSISCRADVCLTVNVNSGIEYYLGRKVTNNATEYQEFKIEDKVFKLSDSNTCIHIPFAGDYCFYTKSKVNTSLPYYVPLEIEIKELCLKAPIDSLMYSLSEDSCEISEYFVRQFDNNVEVYLWENDIWVKQSNVDLTKLSTLEELSMRVCMSSNHLCGIVRGVHLSPTYFKWDETNQQFNIDGDAINNKLEWRPLEESLVQVRPDGTVAESIKLVRATDMTSVMGYMFPAPTVDEFLAAQPPTIDVVDLTTNTVIGKAWAGSVISPFLDVTVQDTSGAFKYKAMGAALESVDKLVKMTDFSVTHYIAKV